jgi:hypothetical protein
MAAVHVERGAGDVARFVGSKEKDGGGDLLRPGGAAKRHFGQALLLLFLGEGAEAGLHSFSKNKAGRDGIHTNAMGPFFMGEFAGESQNGGLRRRIVQVRHGRNTAAGDGREIDDPSAAARAHAGHDGAAHQEGGGKIDREEGVPFLQIKVLDGAGVGAETHIVDQNVRRADFRFSCGDGGLDGRRFGDLGRDVAETVGGLARLIAESLGEVALRRLLVNDRETPAVRQKLQRRRLADALGAAGQYADLAFKTLSHLRRHSSTPG